MKYYIKPCMAKTQGFRQDFYVYICFYTRRDCMNFSDV